ncbi:MAG: hypothetical protein H0U34_04475 [Sphingomonas sp.]|nr:hypothetical protein [Sphingomonas sp.]
MKALRPFDMQGAAAELRSADAGLHLRRDSRGNFMEDRDRESLRETERTTIIQTDGDRGGGSGVIIAIVVLLVLGVLLFLLFGGGLGGGGDEGDVNVNIEAPEVTLPDIDVPEVTVPETGDADGNSSE